MGVEGEFKFKGQSQLFKLSFKLETMSEVDERDSIRNCNLLIANDNRSPAYIASHTSGMHVTGNRR